MDAKKQLKSFLQEAETYKSQGLLEEAKDKYKSILKFIEKNEQLKIKQNLIEGISKKVSTLEKEVNKVESAPMSTEMSRKMQDFLKIIIKEAEDYGSQGLFAQAKEKYKEAAGFIEKDDQLKNKQKLLDGISKKIKALEKQPEPEPEEEIKEPKAPEVQKQKEITKEEEEDFIDINSVGITIPHGPEKGKIVEFEVSYQSGNMVNLTISSKEKSVIEGFKAGDKLNDIQCYSPIAIFKGSGIVSSNTQIDSGPKQGDYRLEIKITST